MGVFLNRKIFLGEGNGNGAPTLNVNGALGLTAGVAGTNILQNDLIFRSPDVATDWTVANNFPTEPVSANRYYFTFEGVDYLVGPRNVGGVNLVTIYRLNNLNQWEILLTPYSSETTNQKVAGIVPVDNESFVVFTIHGTRNLRLSVYNVVSNTWSQKHDDNVGNNVQFANFTNNINYIVKNRITYIIHYVSDFSYTINQTNTAITTGVLFNIFSYNLDSETISNLYTQSASYKTDTTAFNRRGSVSTLNVVEENGKLGILEDRAVRQSNIVNRTKFWNTLDLTNNNFVSLTGVAPEISSYTVVDVFNLNNKIYAILRTGGAQWTIYEKPVGAGTPFQEITVTNTEDFNLPTTGVSFRPFLFNGVIYMIALFTTAPFFASFAFIDNNWTLLQSPILPFNQNYGTFLENNATDRFNIQNSKVKFATFNGAISPNVFLWESTTNGVFRPKWIKNQQLFTDAIGLAQQTKNANENIGVYQMTPNNSL